MTCVEKLKEMNPLFDDKTVEGVIRGYCPFEWGIEYSYPPGHRCFHNTCKECWNQEIVED